MPPSDPAERKRFDDVGELVAHADAQRRGGPWAPTIPSSGSSNASTQTATVTVGGPAYGYAGPTDVLVYWDTIYNVFMFAFAADAPVLSGQALDGNGKLMAHQEIRLTAGPNTFVTMSDARGDYRFYGAPAGPAQLTIGAVTHPTTIQAPARRPIGRIALGPLE